METRPHPTRSRRERPAKHVLSRVAIVSAALEIMRGEGLERVTMRRLAQVLTSYTRILFEYPSLARYALVAHPSRPRYLTLVERVLALLCEGGVPGDRAAWAVDLLLQFATTVAAEHATRQHAGNTRDDEDAPQASLGNVSPVTYPHIAALGAELLSGPSRLAWAFSVLIESIQHVPRPTPPSPTSRRRRSCAQLGEASR